MYQDSDLFNTIKSIEIVGEFSAALNSALGSSGKTYTWGDIY